MLCPMPTRLVSRARKAPAKPAKNELDRLRQFRPPAVVMPVTFAQGMAALNEEERKVNKSSRARLQGAWKMALEEVFCDRAGEMLAHTEVRGSFGGSLRVSCDSPALAHELGKVKKQTLLARLREFLAGKETLVGLDVRTGKSQS
jgi:Dna[CI] antecedent, DciA